MRKGDINLREVLGVIDHLAATSSRNDKERILAENTNNQLLKDILKFVYDPFILTGISTKKINKDTNTAHVIELNTTEDVMQYLQKNNTGRDIDIANVHHFIYKHDKDLQDFYRQIFTKELKLGFTADTLNKVYGKNFISTFDVMLAKKFEEHKHKITGDFVITKKLDGNRLVVVKEDGVVKSFTRQGKKYDGLEEIESDFINLPIDNIVFDGELIADTGGSTQEIYAETTSKARRKGSNKTGLIFHVFDMLPLSEFKNGKSKQNCIERKHFLSQIFNNHDFQYCQELQPLYIGKDLSQVDVWMEYAAKQEWEGLMINLDCPYVCKRTDFILKVKNMNTCDLCVIDFEEGTGKNVGKLGSIVVDYKGYRCGVGSGFTDVDRNEIWNNQEKYIGKIIEVQYFEESKNAEGCVSLRFPVYKKIRTDKSSPSYN